jgi:hypothetical protein
MTWLRIALRRAPPTVSNEAWLVLVQEGLQFGPVKTDHDLRALRRRDDGGGGGARP